MTLVASSVAFKGLILRQEVEGRDERKLLGL